MCQNAGRNVEPGRPCTGLAQAVALDSGRYLNTSLSRGSLANRTISGLTPPHAPPPLSQTLSPAGF